MNSLSRRFGCHGRLEEYSATLISVSMVPFLNITYTNDYYRDCDMRSTRARSHSGKHKCSILQQQRRKNGTTKLYWAKKELK